jgi:hypothetical protein
MAEDLTELRLETERTMLDALRKAEQFSFLGVRMSKLWFSKNRTKFTIKKGFESCPGEVTITIFGDGNLIFAEKVFLVGTELVYNVSKKYSNLPLKDYTRVCLCISTQGNCINIKDSHNLFMLNIDDKVLFPVNYEQYSSTSAAKK